MLVKENWDQIKKIRQNYFHSDTAKALEINIRQYTPLVGILSPVSYLGVDAIATLHNDKEPPFIMTYWRS